MNRVNHNILTEIKGLEEQLGELKGVQPLGGNSFVNYSFFTGNQYDVAVTMNTSMKAARLHIEFTNPGAFQIMNLATFLRVDNPNVMASPLLPSPGQTYFLLQITETPYNDRISWILDFHNNDYPTSHMFYLKFHLSGTTTGTVFFTDL